jgi:hypothetical protein
MLSPVLETRIAKKLYVLAAVFFTAGPSAVERSLAWLLCDKDPVRSAVVSRPCTRNNTFNLHCYNVQQHAAVLLRALKERF